MKEHTETNTVRYNTARKWLNFMSTAFFIFGFCQAVTGFMAWMLLRREEEKVKDSP